MKRWLATGIALFVLGTQIAWSATPGLPQLLRATGESEDKRVDTVPDPAQLRADWWLYFNVPDAELPDRVAAAKAALERRYGAGGQAGGADTGARPAADAPSHRLAIERIESNLDAYVAASRLDAPEPQAAPPLAEQYTPAEALQLVSALRKTRVDLDFEAGEVAATEAALRSALEQVDRAMAAYLQMAPGTPQRLANGFEIMIERSAAAVTAEQLRVRRATLALREAQIRELSDVERFAEEHLRGSREEIARLAQRIVQLGREVDVAREAVLRETRRMLEPVGPTPLDQYAGRYRQQRAVLAEVELALTQMRLANAQAQRMLAALLATPDVGAAEALEMIERLRAQVAATRRDALDWRTASERERERAGERLAEMGQVTRVDAAVLVNQDRLRMAQQAINALRSLEEELTQASYLMRWLNQSVQANQGWIARAIGSIGDSAAAVRTSVATFTDRSLFKLGETPITLSGLFKLVMIIAIAWLVSWVLRRILSHLTVRLPKDSLSLTFVISRLAHYLIIAIGVIAGLSSIGLNLTNFALVAGALALGLGFGLQSIVNNFLSGLVLFFERSIKVGDFVQLDNGERGEVKAINVRGTIVNTNDNIDVVVPNSEFIERKVINWTLLDPFRRIHVPFRVAYESDEDKVVEAGLDAAGRLSSTLTGVLGREPSVWLVNYGENGLDFELIVWLMPDAVKRPDAVFAAYHWEIRKALRRHGIEVPVPQREIRFRGAIPQALDPAPRR